MQTQNPRQLTQSQGGTSTSRASSTLALHLVPHGLHSLKHLPMHQWLNGVGTLISHGAEGLILEYSNLKYH